MGSPPLQISTAPFAGRHLCVQWLLDGDRWKHTIWLVCDQSEQPLLSSMEGSLDDDWPPTGPIQECHQQAVAAGSALFGVGMAGSSHWSVAVETVANDTVNALQFDYACRVRAKPQTLGNVYQWQCPASEMQDGLIRIGSPGVMLRVVTVDGSDVGAEIAHVDDGRMRIRYPIVADPRPATYRWRYRIGLETKEV